MPQSQDDLRRLRARQRLLAKYGLTTADYAALLDAQQGACAVCRSRPIRSTLNVDHDHALARRAGPRASVRGLLCYLCNRFLMRGARDRAELCRRAAEYLDSPPARSLLLGPARETDTPRDRT